MLLFWYNAVIPDIAITQIVSYILVYSYHFIANSTSYLNAAGVSDNFLVPVISQIESIEVGWVEGELGRS